MPTEIILSLIVKIAVMIALGYTLKKINIITESLQKGLTDILLKAIMPLSILMSANYAFNGVLFHGMLIVAAAAVGFYVIGLTGMTFFSKALRLQENERKIIVTMTVFANTGFVGFPIMLALFGQPGLLLAVIFNMFYNLFMYTYGINMLSGKGGYDIKSIFLNPITIASLASIAIFVSPFRLPAILASPIEDIGAMSVPISMIIMGASLAKIPLMDILKDKYSYLVSGIRLVLFPLLMLLVMHLLSVSSLTANVCVLMTALPCGTMNVIFAEKYDCAPEFASRTVIQSLVLMIITLPLMILLTSLVFPVS
ncbi:MAG: AEC family transporter [Eubacteriales bacterium]